MNPKTVPEWQHYVTTLAGADLRSKAIAANSVRFVRMLELDGLEPAEVSAVFVAFAQQMIQEGQDLPGQKEGCYLDYNDLVYNLNPELGLSLP